MGQDLSQLTENVPSLLGSVLLKIGQEVAMDLHESSMQDIFEPGEDDDDVIAEEEEMAMASLRYFGIWQDEKGRPFYYDAEQQAYFFLENPQPFTKIGCEKEEEEEEEKHCSSSSSSSSTSGTAPKRSTISSSSSSANPVSTVSHFSFLSHKIVTDLRIIYSNVTHSVSMLLERGDDLERTRQKVEEMMATTSSLERQSRCLTCAQRCNSIWPGTGYIFILKIADAIPMSACCQDDGICGPHVYMSEEELDDDIDLDDEFQHAASIPDNLTDCHLE